MKGEITLMLTQEELEKCENPYEEIAKMTNGLVEELKDREYNRGYEKGMEDAFETFKKIELVGCDGGLSKAELFDIFGPLDIPNILKRNSAKEAKEKIENYIKEKSEFHVGDEVECKGSICNKGLVISIETINTGETFLRVMFSDTLTGAYIVNDVGNKIIKTGRHFDEVEKLLKMLKED